MSDEKKVPCSSEALSPPVPFASAFYEANPSDEILEDRTRLLDEVCTWLSTCGWKDAAETLYRRRAGFQLTKQRTKEPVPGEYCNACVHGPCKEHGTPARQRPNEPVRPDQTKYVITCDGEPRTDSPLPDDWTVYLDRGNGATDEPGWQARGPLRRTEEEAKGDATRTCEVCDEEPAAVCKTCQRQHIEEAIDHYIDDKGGVHCRGCNASGVKCPGMPRTEPAKPVEEKK